MASCGLCVFFFMPLANLGQLDNASDRQQEPCSHPAIDLGIKEGTMGVLLSPDKCAFRPDGCGNI